MLADKLKNKTAEQASLKPVTYIIEPKVLTKINVYDLSFHINADQIVNSICDYRNKNQKSNTSNIYAWHTCYHLHNHTKDFDTLIKVVEDRVFHSLDQTTFRKVECIESWAVMYKKGDKTVRHKHSDQQYSAVYYAKAEQNAAPIKFDNHLSITPKTGMLVCFPGWLFHSVSEITDDQERICMAFNLNCSMTDTRYAMYGHGIQDRIRL